ncbi:MAG: hypothetical protein R2755_18725 [Acidimicrobiales bacterium]
MTAEEARLVVVAHPGLVLGGADGDEQGDEVVLARVRFAGGGARSQSMSRLVRSSPVVSTMVSVSQVSNVRDGTAAARPKRERSWKLGSPLPTMSTPSSRRGASARPAARWACGSNPRRIDSCTIGTSASGNMTYRGYERAVVEAADVVPLGRQPCGGQQFHGATGELGIAGCRIPDAVGLRWEAAVVVEHRRLRAALERECGRLPVGGHHEHRLRPAADVGAHGGQCGLER